MEHSGTAHSTTQELLVFGQNMQRDLFARGLADFEDTLIVLMA
jgi:hypothetical protein